MSVIDQEYMHRALALARRGEGQVAPNPPVGCVLVKDGVVIAEGWHRGPGHPHAEADALTKVGPNAVRGATAYVTLEPCNHYGKTPPCAEALVQAEVARVVFAVPDPNPIAAGGAERLAAAGITVQAGCCEAEGRALLRPWLLGLTRVTPYVYAKVAMTLDGRTATNNGDSKWITGAKARDKGHLLRQRTDAILVGVGTVLADDPGLDPRPRERTPSQTLKVILDTHLRTPATAKCFSSPGAVLIGTGADPDPARREALEQVGAEILQLPSVNGKASLANLLSHLKKRDLTSVMIEGGGTLLGAAFDQNLIDEVWAFIAPAILGGGRSAIAGVGPTKIADAFELQDVMTETLGSDLFIRGYIERKVAACSQAL
ncbi:MAG: bifunctional diaminohydroxyphosphoribosylaminopyrimidine deaminase/5-amino-6-(5-phosphoribosylamino)uracil reductase RibD [Pseudomonadota bacterium]